MGISLAQGRPLRVAMNCQLLPNSGKGGVENWMIGLVHALGQLNDGPDEYVIIGPWQDPEWMKSYIGPNQRIVRGEPQRSSLGRVLGPLLRPLAGRLRNHLVRLLGFHRIWPEPTISDGFYENLGCDAIHFPYQDFAVCALPMIYNPHDLQHLYYPQFFAPSTVAWRDVQYLSLIHI